jgi:hypothetical protein
METTQQLVRTSERVVEKFPQGGWGLIFSKRAEFKMAGIWWAGIQIQV